MKAWTKERCATRPDTLQLISADTYMERKNIEEEEHDATDEQAAYTDYVCDCREISISEYQMLKSIEEYDATEAVDAYTLQLIEEGVL